MNVFQFLTFTFLFYFAELYDHNGKEIAQNLLSAESGMDLIEKVDYIRIVNPSFDDQNDSKAFATHELHACLKKIDCIIVSDQAKSGVYIYSLSEPENPIWSLNFEESKQIPDSDRHYFKAISDAKLVYKDYVAVVCSGGAVALIELETARIIRYFIVGGNLHSLDLTPDGAIFVVASEQNFITAIPGINKKCQNEDSAVRKWSFPYGHAVVYDYANNKIWIGGNRTIQSFKYNYDSQDPRIIPFESFYVEDDEIHDIHPIMNSDYLWLTTINYVYIFNHKTGSIMRYYAMKNVKSISSRATHPDHMNGRIGRALDSIENRIDSANIQNMYKQGGIKKWTNERTIHKELNDEIGREARHLDSAKKVLKPLLTIYVTPKEEWWTDEVRMLDTNQRAFLKEGAKIYKARYLQFNTFSYEQFYPKKWD